MIIESYEANELTGLSISWSDGRYYERRYKRKNITREELMQFSINNPSFTEFYSLFKEYIRVMSYFGQHEMVLWVALFAPEDFKYLTHPKHQAFGSYIRTIEANVKGQSEFFKKREYPIINFKKLFEGLSAKDPYRCGTSFIVEEIMVDGKVHFKWLQGQDLISYMNKQKINNL